MTGPRPETEIVSFPVGCLDCTAVARGSHPVLVVLHDSGCPWARARLDSTGIYADADDHIAIVHATKPRTRST